MLPLKQLFKFGKEREPSLPNTASTLPSQAGEKGWDRHALPQVLPLSQARLEAEHAGMLWRKANTSCPILTQSGQNLGQVHLAACKANYLSPDPNRRLSHGIQLQILDFPLDPAISSPSS